MADPPTAGGPLTLTALGALALAACAPCGDAPRPPTDRPEAIARLDGTEELRALLRDGERRAVLRARIGCF